MLEIRRDVHMNREKHKQTYETIYQENGMRQLDSFYLWLLDLLHLRPRQRLLDVACGQGVIPHMAADIDLEAHGIDLSENAIRVGRDQTSVMLLVGDGERLPYADGSFDCVTSIGSLEHYLNMEQGVKEMVRVLTPDGLACVLLPNTFSLLDNIWTAFRTGRSIDDGQPIQRYAARYEWETLLNRGGLVVKRTVKYEREWPRSLHDAVWYLRHFKALIRLMLTPFVPLNLASCFVYLCQRAN